MVEEDEKTDIVVSDKELNDVEAEVKRLDADKEREVADKVRKEMETESKMKELETAKTELEAKLAEQKEALEKSRKEQEAAMSKIVEQRVADEVAKRKGLVNNQQPFEEQPAKSPVENLTPEQVKAVETSSYEAFMEAARKKN